MNTSFHYTPDVVTDFHCNVPLKTLQQLVLINGVCKDIVAAEGYTVAPYADGKGIDLTITAGQLLATPIQIINTRNAGNMEKLAYANRFVVASQAQAKLLICDHTLSPDPFETETVTDIDVKEGSHLEIVWMQSEHNKSQHRSVIRIRQAAKSVLTCHLVALHGALIENRITVQLQGEEAECRANGLFLIDGHQQYLTDITIAHEAGHCRSNQLFKGILDNQAIGRFHGRVLVAKGAQKTEAYQANNNLLLTKQAKMITQPQLEIYADDVKCSHGATIGQLDEQALFYFRSRGISFKEACLLQQIGFVQDVLDKINLLPLRERIADLVVQRLKGEFSRCADCELHCC